ncbi:inactive polyglycylase TTLL10 [Artibeus jamaicensis]|uniref:inactive polyglycylase TTLL10 n=1 Tax=Artibeus jamaicensis TaxID=9417 RepID=UPI00235B21ED|nr:inactive polyglycylase TTLL10 [Artibeus jamaicensis]
MSGQQPLTLALGVLLIPFSLPSPLLPSVVVQARMVPILGPKGQGVGRAPTVSSTGAVGRRALPRPPPLGPPPELPRVLLENKCSVSGEQPLHSYAPVPRTDGYSRLLGLSTGAHSAPEPGLPFCAARSVHGRSSARRRFDSTMAWRRSGLGTVLDRTQQPGRQAGGREQPPTLLLQVQNLSGQPLWVEDAGKLEKQLWLALQAQVPLASAFLPLDFMANSGQGQQTAPPVASLAQPTPTAAQPGTLSRGVTSSSAPDMYQGELPLEGQDLSPSPLTPLGTRVPEDSPRLLRRRQPVRRCECRPRPTLPGVSLGGAGLRRLLILLDVLGRFTRAFRPSRRSTVSRRSLHLARQRRGQRVRSCRAGLAQDRQNEKTSVPLRGTKPHSHRGDRSRLPLESQVQDPRRRPCPSRRGLTACQIRGLGQQAARRSHRRVGATSSQRCPRLSAPAPAAHSHARSIQRRGRRPRAQVSTRRGKRSRVTGVWRSHVWGPGWAHERPMGSSQRDRLLCQLSQLGQDADPLEDPLAGRPRAALLEKHLLGAEQQSPSTGCGPFFYVGGTNGASIISSYCKSKGWQRIQDSRRGDYKLKWCEVKCRDSYSSFREGEQLLYQIPNNRLLTTKIGLLSTLREYSRVVSKTSQCTQAKSGNDPALDLEELPWMSPGCLGRRRFLKMEEFFPETYRLDIKEEREAFFTLFDETQTWICKPTASNQGKGIFLLRNQEEVATLQAKTQSIEEDPMHRKMPFRAPQARIVQRYIQNPLLLDGKKFDVRAYLLIACTVPYMVFFGHGYARLTLNLYDPCSQDLSGHLTNQFMQKKSPLYVLLKEDTVWSMEQLNRYINHKFREPRGLPSDWVFTTFTKQMQQIMAHCFLAVKSKLECKLGYFDLIGCDFLIDDNFKVWLLEMNSNPALHTNCEVLKEVVPRVVTETLDLALETFQKSLRGHRMLPLLSQRRFVLLLNGETDLWPRPGSSRNVPRPPPRLASEAASTAPQTRAADQLGARRPRPPRSAQGHPRPHSPGPDGAPGSEGPRADNRNLAREASPGSAEEDREGRRSEDHRGS